MEARDRLEEQLSESCQALEAAQAKHDHLSADLEQATNASATGRPEDAARIAQLSDQVSLLPFPCAYASCLRFVTLPCFNVVMFYKCACQAEIPTKVCQAEQTTLIGCR